MSAVGQGEGQQTQGENGGGEAQQSPDVNQMVEQLGQVASGMEEMRTFLASQPWQQQAGEGEDQQQADPNELDLSWLDPNAQTYEDPQAVAARLNEVINGAVDQRAQQLIAPLQAQQAELRRDQEARDLAGEFPELADEKMAKMIAGPDGLAVQMAQVLGQPALAHEPAFWRMTYLAHKATEANNAQNGDAPNAANLESGSGPGPANQPSPEDRIKQIMNAGGRGASVLDFKT